jgi:aspartate 1-decarboxylase
MRTVLRSKLHGATVTEADPDYEGSITIDRELMVAADLAAYERVLVANVTNGERFETYVIEGEAGSGAIGLNGAAAHLGRPGDRVIIMSFGIVDGGEVDRVTPRVVLLDADNRIKEILHRPA